MRLEHHLVGGYVRYISPHIIIIIIYHSRMLINQFRLIITTKFVSSPFLFVDLQEWVCNNSYKV